MVKRLIMQKKNEFLKRFLEQYPVKVSESNNFKETEDDLLVIPTNSKKKLINFIENNKTFVYLYILKLLYNGVKNNLDSIEYFAIGNTGMILAIDKEDIEDSVKKMYDHFVETELYEAIPLCIKILDLYKINKLLESI